MMRRVLPMLLLSLFALTGCEEENPEVALKSTGAMVSKEEGRTTLRFEAPNEADQKLQRINFQLGVSFIRIGSLIFSRSDVSDRGIEQVTRIKDLEILTISECKKLTNRSMSLIGMNPKLVELTVTHTRADDAGFESIGKLQQLRKLEISGIREKTLGQIGKLRNLDTLTLIDSKIDESGARSLARLTSLRILEFYRCDMSENIEQQVRRALPQCRITINRL